MATATTPPPLPIEPERAQWQRQVSDPLERLRGTIRLYVTLEGLALALVYLALWFWIGLVLDYGFFRLFGVDWVQVVDGWRGLRGFLLVVLSAGLAALLVAKVLRRLMHEFGDRALALVLERRFSTVLGDRLITAVELADPAKAQQYGHSQPMVDRTIREAADRVGAVPIQEAFNWKRLVRYGQVVVVLIFGLYLLAGAGYAVFNWQRARDFMPHFNNLAAIWLERNILLENTIWPRQAHLELVEFPQSGELKIAKNVGTAALRVQAFKWVVADPKAYQGWRALRWRDLEKKENRDLLAGRELPPLPEDLANIKIEDPPYLDATLDHVEQELDRLRDQLDADTLLALRGIIESLTAQAGRVAMNRRLRLLELPQTVTVYYYGAQSSNEMTLKPEADNEFSGLLSDLKESVKFKAVARDFSTPPRTIGVVPAPALAELYRAEAQPAYLFHRPPAGGSLEDLKGLKQQFSPQRVYLGDETTVIGVPAGTDLTLTGVIDKGQDKETDPEKRLAAVTMLPRAEKGQTTAAQPLTIQPSLQSFVVTFSNVTGRIDFDLELVDTDQVKSRRHLIVEPKADLPPEVDVFVDVIRKTSEGYKVTPIALVPFSGPARAEGGQEKFHGRARDDHGLEKVQYAFTITRLEAVGVLRGKAADAAIALQLAPLDPASLLAAAPLLAYAGWRVEPNRPEPDRAQTVPLATFEEELLKRARFSLSRPDLLRRIAQPPERGPQRSPLLREFTLDADREFFDLRQHLPYLLAKGQTTFQPRYRLRLWVTAGDNNVESGPRHGESKERFTLIVVSETELLAEIAKEEENLHLKLDQTLTRLKDAQNKLEVVAKELEEPKIDDKTYSALATRVLEIAEVIATSAITAREVQGDYARIAREERVNRVTPAMIDKVERIANLLDLALRNHFTPAEDAQLSFQKALEGKKTDKALAQEARQRLLELIARIQEVIDNMDKLIDINKLITSLRSIEEEQRDNIALFRYLKERIEDKLLEDILNPKKP